MGRPITVRLVGGLGNQLFGYYAGAALATRHGVPLRLDTSWTRHGITDHGVAIRDLNLPGEWLDDRRLGARLSAPGSVPARAVAKAQRQVPALRRPFRVYEASGVGDDPDLLRQPPGTRLRGYFQSWATVQAAVDAGYPRRPALRRPSPWLAGVAQRAAKERPISVHVRRGDYAKVDVFGLLGPDYYERALRSLRDHGIDGPVWLFSDEPAKARDLLPQADEVLSASPVEEMLAMSHAAAHVVANSTFSWWGAWMNDPGTPVVAPEPWFRSGPAVNGLIPPGWTLIRAWT